MDDNRLFQLKQLATDSLVVFADNEKVYQLAQALEEMTEAVSDYDSMTEKSETLDEENAELHDQVKELNECIRDIYRTSKSADSSDVKRLAEIQEICESSDVDLTKII